MIKELKCLFAILALLCLNQELQAATVPFKPSQKDSGVGVLAVKDIKDYNKSNPSYHLQELNKTVIHTFGERLSGDKLLFVMEDTHYYPLNEQNNAKSQVVFPENSNTTISISHVEISFKSQKDDGNVYVVDGGIGKGFVLFIVEAPKTGGPFAFKTEIFGTENH